MKRSTYFIAVFSLLSSITFAQETKPEKSEASSDKAISVAFHPLFLFNNALKIDAELQTQKPLAFIVGAEFYSGRTQDLYTQTNRFGEPTEDKISGIGINLALKYKADQSGQVNSYYFSPGLTYRYLNMELNGPGFYSYLQDGIEYQTYGDSQHNYKLHPVLIYGNFGRYYELNSVVADIYLGIGYKALAQNDELKKSRNYHKSTYGYNYRGPILQFGIKLGWQIKK